MTNGTKNKWKVFLKMCSEETEKCVPKISEEEKSGSVVIVCWPEKKEKKHGTEEELKETSQICD